MRIRRIRLADATALAAAVWIGGVVWKDFFLCDDALTSLRTALNASGRGSLSFNLGERVLTFDNPLWVSLECTVVGGLRSLWLPALRAASAAAMAVATFVTVRRSAGPKAWLLALCLPFVPLFREGVCCGLEAPLAALLLSLAAARLCDQRASEQPGASRATLLLGSLTTLCKFWAGALLLPAALREIAAGPPWRRIRDATLAGLPLAVWAAFSLVYFRGLVPHPLHGVAGGVQGARTVLSQGLMGVLEFLIHEPLDAALAGCAAALAASGLFGARGRDFTVWLGLGLVTGTALSFLDGESGWSPDRVALLDWLAFVVLAYDRRIPNGLFALVLASAAIFSDNGTSARSLPPASLPALPSRMSWSEAVVGPGRRRIVLAAEPGRTGLERGPAPYVIDRFALSDPFWSTLNRRAGAMLEGGADTFAPPVGTWMPEGIVGGPLHGTVEIELRLREEPAGFCEPILSVGEGGDGDVYMIQHFGSRRIRLAVHKVERNMTLCSTLIPQVDFSRTHRLLIQYGTEPLQGQPKTLIGWDGSLIRRIPGLFGARRYEPWETTVGWNTLGARDCSVDCFTGDLIRVEAASSTQAAALLPCSANVGIADFRIALRVKIPAKTAAALPLLTTGRELASDALFVRPAGPGAVRFGFDPGDSAEWGPPAALDFARAHTIRIYVLNNGVDSKPESALTTVSLDGRVVFTTTHAFRSYKAEDVYLLQNPLQVAGCEPTFEGEVLGIASRPLHHAEASDAEAAPESLRSSRGPVALLVLFKKAPFRIGQALVETGRPGRGDIVYVVRDDATHVRFGFDHWGVGGAVGPALRIDPTIPHQISVDAPPMLAVHGSPAGTVTVTLDGTPALTANFACYQVPQDELYIGANRLHASTTGLPFQGIIIDAWRL